MIRFLALLLSLALLAGQVFALEPSQREALVINGRVWDGFAYKEMLLPSSLTTLTLMSGRDSAITFARTQEYYWPLSRQVYVDFERQRNEISGVLRIDINGKVSEEVRQSFFSIVYPKGAINGDGQLLWGEEAVSAFNAHQEEERTFARRYTEARQAQSAYERALLEAGAARNRGEAFKEVAAPPPLPEPSLRLVTRPVSGYRINLPPGTHRLALYVDGKRVPDSQRMLRVIDAEGRRTVVGDIVPEERWTRPLASNSEASRIFARPGSTFYLTLTDADRYDEAEYAPIVTPQAEVVAGRASFVRRKPSELTSVALSWGGGVEETNVTLTPLKVEQTQGSGFGYRVRGAREGEKPELKAFVISVPDDPAARRGTITVGNGRDNFAREVVVVQPRNATFALIVAVLPILLLGLSSGWQRFGRRARLGGVFNAQPRTGRPAPR